MDYVAPYESRFTGGLAGLLGVTVLQYLLIFVTLGLGAPWAVCIKENWVAKHTILNGRQLYFDGKGSQLIGNYLKWFLLTIVTFGIYGFWLGINMKKWVVKHTHMR